VPPRRICEVRSQRALEAPVVRDIRRDFAAITENPDRDATVAPESYGNSAERRAEEGSDEGFAAALARAKSRTAPKKPGSRPSHWRPVILQALLDEVIVPRRPDHLDESDGGYFRCEVKQAAKLNAQWAEADCRPDRIRTVNSSTLNSSIPLASAWVAAGTVGSSTSASAMMIAALVADGSVSFSWRILDAGSGAIGIARTHRSNAVSDIACGMAGRPCHNLGPVASGRRAMC